MKKILISLLAVAGVLSACDKIEKVKLPAEDDIVPPVLKEAPATIAVTEDNGDTEAVFVFELADFKQKVAASYSLFAVYGAETKSVISLSNTGEAKVTYTAFNKGLMTAFPEIIAGKAFDLEVKVGVTVGNTFGTVYSNSKTIKVTTVALQERETNYPDYKDVSTWGLTGSLSAYDISWNGDVVMYTNGTKHLAENVEIKAGEEFKFRKDGKWDLAVGSSTGENFTVTLGEEFVGNAEPGSKNLLVPEDGKFDLFLDPETNKILVVKHGDNPAPQPETLDIPAVASAALVLSETESEALTVVDGEGEITVKTAPAGPDGNTVLIKFTNPEGVVVSAVDKGEDFTSAEVAEEGAAAKFIVPANETEAEVTRVGTVTFAKGELTATLTVKVLQAAKEAAPDPETPVTLYFTCLTPVENAVMFKSDILGTAAWPGDELTEYEKIAGKKFYKKVVKGGDVWDKTIDDMYIIDKDNWNTTASSGDFSGNKTAYYFQATKSVALVQLSERPVDPEITIDGTFTDWANIGGGEATHTNYKSTMKAYSDGTALYVYIRVDQLVADKFDLASDDADWMRLYFDKDNDATTGSKDWYRTGADDIDDSNNDFRLKIKKSSWGFRGLLAADGNPYHADAKYADTADYFEIEIKFDVAALSVVNTTALADEINIFCLGYGPSEFVGSVGGILL